MAPRKDKNKTSFWKARYDKVCAELQEERELRKEAEYEWVRLARENKAMKDGRKMAVEIMGQVVEAVPVN